MDEYIESFSHGPVVSKIWLCEELEQVFESLEYKKPSVNILGGWVNVLGFMLQVRKPYYYKEINSYDKDNESTRLSDKICDAWQVGDSRIHNITTDVSNLKYIEGLESVFVNCSVDQFEDTIWYNNIPNNSLVCLQTTDIIGDKTPWVIRQQTRDIDDLINRYPFNRILYSGSMKIKYGHELYYNRLMVIGIK